jgi:D-alanine-D-alanine ligase
MKLVITCEIKQQSQLGSRPRLDRPWDLDSEHLSKESLAEIQTALMHLGYEVEIAENHEALFSISKRYEDLLGINLSVGHGGPSTKVFTAALLEILGIPYVGSPPHSLAITRDKSICKAVAQWLGIPTPQWKSFAPGSRIAAEVKLPVIVKPLHESCSVGIHAASVIHEEQYLVQAITRIWDVYRQPALVEQYIPGIDIEVPFIGGAQVLGYVAVVPQFLHKRTDILTAAAVYQDAYDFTEPDHLTQWSTGIETKLQSWVLGFGSATSIRDYGRVDFRVTSEGTVYFIEASTHPYLGRHSSFFWLYERAGRQYKELWNDLLNVFFRRQAQTDHNVNQPKPLRVGRG